MIDAFLADLARENRSPHTRRAYAADLTRFASFHSGPLAAITDDVLRSFFFTLTPLRPAAQARAQAAVASFLAWADRHALIAATPMAHVARVRHAPPAPRGLDRETIQAILAAIPATQPRDRLLFRLLAATGLRVGAVLALAVEDLDLAPDRAHLHVVGPDQRRRTVLLTDPDLLQEMRSYLTGLGDARGLLFRAQKNGGAGPLRYQSVQRRWQRYCVRAGVSHTLNQLRRTHSVAVVQAGRRSATQRPEQTRQHLPRRDAGPSAAPARPDGPPPVDIVGCLRQSRPMRALTEAALAGLAARMQCEVYPRGELYLDPAEALERFYVVLQGQVSFYRLASDGRKLTMDIKRVGDVYWFASRDWPGGLKSSAEVLSDDTLLGRLALRDVRHLMMDHPSFAVALFDEVCGVAVRLSDRLEELAYEVVAVRLAHTLATRARANGQRIVTETHDELAWLTGASRARVTKELQRLRQLGLIAYEPHHHGIRVLDPERLEAL